MNLLGAAALSACGERGQAGPRPNTVLEAPASRTDLDNRTPLIRLSAEAADAAVLVGADGDVHVAWVTAGTRGRTLLHASLPSSRAPQVDTIVQAWPLSEPRRTALDLATGALEAVH
jgi:hypothetical protein